MTDEENKAIKDCDSIFICLDDAMSEDSANDYRKSYKILKNLIEKQQKEIEELKQEKEYLNCIIESDKDNYTNNDKIKAKIEEYKEKCKNCNFRGKICKEFKQNYNCTIAMCLKEFYSLLEKE